MVFNFTGIDTDFKNIFFTYAVDREGYKVKVYKDVKGYPTVGVGHLVRPSDNLSVGDIITEDQVVQLFYDDYDALDIDKYVQEAAQNYNQALAIAHFIWGHGEEPYADSDLRKHILNKDLDLNGMLDYLNNNWDRSSSSNQNINAYDLKVFYSNDPWQPAKSMDYYVSKIKNFFDTGVAAVNGYASKNPTETVLIVVATLTALGFYIKHLVKKGKAK